MSGEKIFQRLNCGLQHPQSHPAELSEHACIFSLLRELLLFTAFRFFFKGNHTLWREGWTGCFVFFSFSFFFPFFPSLPSFLLLCAILPTSYITSGDCELRKWESATRGEGGGERKGWKRERGIYLYQ